MKANLVPRRERNTGAPPAPVAEKAGCDFEVRAFTTAFNAAPPDATLEQPSRRVITGW
jgi:hypothetical protein